MTAISARHLDRLQITEFRQTAEDPGAASFADIEVCIINVCFACLAVWHFQDQLRWIAMSRAGQNIASQVIMLRLGTKWLYQLASRGELHDKTRQRLKMFCTVIGTLADEYASNPTGECKPPATPEIERQSLR